MTVRCRVGASVAAAFVLFSAPAPTARQAANEEQVARRQLESGRAFLRQGNYLEALKDFRAVAETHASTSVADDALLEIARYFLDIAGDPVQAAAAVDALLRNYATSDSAPDGYVMAGRLALARSRQAADLDAALANFDRVIRLFPTSDAVARSLQLSGETFYLSGRLDDALANLGRVTAEYPAGQAAAEAYLAAGRVLVALGRPVLAMEELQQVRNRWPESDAAAIALDRITLLHRLYVRAPAGTALTLSTETIGPARLRDVVRLVRTPQQRIYWSSRSGMGVLDPGSTDRLPVFTRFRGLTADVAGNPVAIDSASLKPLQGDSVAILLPDNEGGARALDKIVDALQTSNGQWLVMDEDQRAIHRFERDGKYAGVFATARVTRFALGGRDEVAAIERDGREVLVFDGAGKALARVALRSGGLDLRDPVDVAFDDFGHLYVLGRNAVAVFSPHPAPKPEGAPSAAAGYRLMTVHTAPRQSGGFDRAEALLVDRSGGLFIYDGRAERILVYR
ncbi:MAG TPA: tetratricopeptide repeat protein [Vicinamibacterales bacterium]|nr:tetratricopeptide repeat protein [Vicinamibacterales bacterium]